MKVLVVIGTRPEAIKLAPVVRELRGRAAVERARVRVCVTAQHRELLDEALSDLELVPDEDLGIMTDGQTPTRVFSEVMARLEPVLDRDRPDWVVVQGDTTSTAAASVAAFYAGARVAHVEAGLRSGRPREPFPEEMNRRWTSCTADLHLAPSEHARAALVAEGVPGDRIVVTGNPGLDSLRWAVQQEVDLDPYGLGEERLPAAQRLVLVTAHRRESFGSPLEDILLALRRLARSRPDVRIVYPVHPNPRVRETVERLLTHAPGNLVCTGPLPYRVVARLLSRACVVLTDSGGLQEEAPFLGKPTLVLRDVTERLEVVEAGTARLVGTRGEDVAGAVEVLLDDPEAYATMAVPARPYGDGDASRRIADALFRERADGPWEGRAVPGAVEVAG
jgi:UDP-N-acetylglucosamine 2-epimerase (non-hydrolysing)